VSVRGADIEEDHLCVFPLSLSLEEDGPEVGHARAGVSLGRLGTSGEWREASGEGRETHSLWLLHRVKRRGRDGCKVS